MKRYLHRLSRVFVLILFGFSLPAPAWSHNGAVAVAYPIEHITIDGDLSDWPEELERYPVHDASYGDKPENEADFHAAFRLGYDAREGALYVAVEVEDDSLVINVANPNWDDQDGCEVYIYASHPAANGSVTQYALWGRERRIYTSTEQSRSRPWQGVRLGVARRARRHIYEWRLALDVLGSGQVPLTPGTVLGIDLGIYDKDGDGSLSYMAWGPSTWKINDVTRLGDVLLTAAHAPLGRLQGSLRWSGDRAAISDRRVRIQAQDRPDSWVETATDPQGSFAVTLPVGTYRILPTAGNRTDTLGQLAVLEPGRTAEVDLLLPSSQGQAAEVGPGKQVVAGRGSRQGLWHTFNQLDGLLDQNVTSLAIDRKGQLWIGTTGGLSRYDGHTFTTFTTADGLPHNDVQCLLEDSTGQLWIGTWGGGVSRYDGHAFTTFTTKDGLSHNDVQCLLEDRAGQLWIGTFGGLSRFDGHTFTTFTTKDGLAGNFTNTLVEDRAGQLWIGTTGGLSRFDGHTFTTFTTKDGLAGNDVQALAPARDGGVWIGSTIDAGILGGLSRYDGHTFTTFTTEDGLAHDNVRSLLEDSAGQLWISTEGGLSRYDGHTFTTFTTADGLAHNDVQCLLEDRAGQLWIGTKGGLSRHDGRIFTSFTLEDLGFPLPDGRQVWVEISLLEDGAGRLWIGTRQVGDTGAGARETGWPALSSFGGLSRFDGYTFTTFTTADGLPHNRVQCLLEDRAGQLWIGTGRGLSRYDGHTFTTFTTEDGLIDNHVNALAESRKGGIWVGTDGGLSYCDGGRFTSFTTADGLVDNSVGTLAEMRTGPLWIGTRRGLSRYDGHTFTTFTTADGLPHNHAHRLLEDRAGPLWIGTWGGGGLSRYDGHTFTHLSTADGLAHNDITALREDGAGRLWIGTVNGLSRLDPESGVFQNLYTLDGLSDNIIHDITIASNGDVWLSTHLGLTRYRPDSTPPVIVLDQVIAGHARGPAAEISLPSTNAFLAFAFHGISLKTRSRQMVYFYRLRGYDDTWRRTGQKRVEYADLPRGDYIFEVKVMDRDLVHSAEPARTQVHIHFPYERLAWICALILTALLIVWQAGRLIQSNIRLARTNQQLAVANRQIQEATRHKSDFLARMSHDLRTPMNAIIGYTRILLRRAKDVLDERQFRNLDNIQISANNLLSLINDILDLSKIEAGRIDIEPEEVDLKQLSTECIASVESLVKAGVQLKKQLENVRPIRTDADRIRRVVMNLLSNALKFTEQGSITVSLRPVDNWVELSVADTGLGIPPEDLPHIFDEFRQVESEGGKTQEGTGLGLSIAKKSVELLGGTIKVESEAGKGTKFNLRIQDYEKK